MGRRLPAGLRYFLIDKAHKQALARYTFKTYPGKITLLRAVDRWDILSRREDPTLGWGRLAGGGLEIHDISTDHISMFHAPHVGPFAKFLKTILLQPEIVPRRQPAA
jgi:thioesterase domain-containing protein